MIGLGNTRLVDEGVHADLLSAFRSLLPLGHDLEPRFRAVLVDCLDHPGHLLRAQLAHALLVEQGLGVERARSAAIGIEYFHTASLILDDLPSMDDATTRRGRPCPHRVYGEAAALLGALAFINQGYALLWRALAECEPGVGRDTARLVTDCLGPAGILDGQARDLRFDGGRTGDVLRVAEGKTASLLRMVLLLPAVLGRASAATRSSAERLAIVWGTSYQILDDFRDELVSAVERTKSTHRDRALGRPNLPGTAGQAQALHIVSKLIEEGRSLTRTLARDRRWSPLAPMQSLLEYERARIAALLAGEEACA